MIRLETEIIRLSVTAMILTWKWIIRMLKMNPDRWPRERHQEKFSKDITDQSRHQDFENYLKSSSLQLQLIWKKTAIAPKYLNIRCPIFLARTLAQLRLANTHNCRILCSKHCLQLCPKTLCKACGKANEIVDHILSFCQAYDDLRTRKSSSVMLTERSVKILETNYLYESSKSCRNIPLNSGNLEGHISALIAKLKGNHGKKEKVSEKDSKSEVISEVDDNGLENGRNGKEINGISKEIEKKLRNHRLK
ncbi:hypothetical protein KQX54_007550 [Cotesia glomerata]|uniref:Uncharacterized protein n=1 Tax=Cotesia glomerata TaxID=32391 RepID=A0AAV7HQ75_COTGL|nr:hypothetical protein KQX54_007550 [Cotesia glomerata]